MSSIPKIITISMGHSNSYLIVSAGRCILVDCGIGKKTKNIQTALVKNKLNFTELLKSWEKLIASGCMTFYPGHGKLIPL